MRAPSRFHAQYGETRLTANLRTACQSVDAPGPAGEMFARWRTVAQINLGTSGWRDRLARTLPDQVAQALLDFDLARPTGAPAVQAAVVLANVLGRFPRR